MGGAGDESPAPPNGIFFPNKKHVDFYQKILLDGAVKTHHFFQKKNIPFREFGRSTLPPQFLQNGCELG